LGIEGGRLLIRFINGEKDIPKEQKIDLEFITGESSGPPPEKERV
jgi:hypothetical protein